MELTEKQIEEIAKECGFDLTGRLLKFARLVVGAPGCLGGQIADMPKLPTPTWARDFHGEAEVYTAAAWKSALTMAVLPKADGQTAVPNGYRLQPISEFDAYADVLRQINNLEEENARLKNEIAAVSPEEKAVAWRYKGYISAEYEHQEGFWPDDYSYSGKDPRETERLGGRKVKDVEPLCACACCPALPVAEKDAIRNAALEEAAEIVENSDMPDGFSGYRICEAIRALQFPAGGSV